MTEKENFASVVQIFNKEFQRVAWEPDQIYREFARRSVQDIEKSGEIHYLCCLERNYIIGYQAAKKGIDSKLVMMGIKRPLQSLKLATGLELELDGETCIFTSATTGDKLLKGQYPYRNSHFGVQRFDTSQIDPELTWFENFGVSVFDQLSEIIPRLNGKTLLDTIVKKNSPRHLQRSLKTYQRKQDTQKQVYL